MTREELVELLNSLNVPLNEGVPSDMNVEESVRICFWGYIWEPLTASGSEYNTKVTYQISFIAEEPRNEKLLELKSILKERSLYPIIQHEYVIEDRRWHSYFSLEVLENV